ncbi:alkaline phosphatase family protein [Halosegnis marinus]|uniref:Alkaline phosphatase family protein n=1 Tax=Halosegnis marinus TaxID=3034023 RepID=A0ABD5ZS26_9EURY|nr:alkaline phosphatase family protein [Halosegnis sp. DT85]
MATHRPDDRAVVLGLDGVPWDLIDRWTEAGELPAFARLRREGAAGPLASTTPPTTPLAWPSIATGVWPDKHGIHGFRRLTRDYGHELYGANACRHPRLWEMVSPAHVGNVPMTYPAGEVDGKLVAGMLSRSTGAGEGFTHPPELADEVAERIPDYRIGLSWADYADDPDALVADIGEMVEARRELFRLLAEDEPAPWRLLFFVFTAPDRLQHLVWDEDVLLDHYERLDDVLAEVMETVEERGATLYVVSDHGFGPVERHANVNTALAEAGYLARKGSASRGTLARLGVSKAGVKRALGSVGIDDRALVRALPDALVRGVAATVPGDHVLFDVDYPNTTAFCYGPGLVYVNDTERFAAGTVAPEDVPAVRAEVAAMLRDVTDPETGEAALDVYEGGDGEGAPDLVVDARDPLEVSTSLADAVFTDPESVNASHRSEGVLLAWGPDIAPGSAPAAASVVDLAPTLLHVLGEPVPAGADGRVLHEILRPDSGPGTREVETREYRTRERSSPAPRTDRADAGDVEDRLRGLGYIE